MPQLIALPAFFDDEPPGSGLWRHITDAADVVDIAVFDDWDVLAGVKGRLKDAGIRVFGYVATGTGTVDPDVYGPHIDTWFERHPDLDGMFVDEGPPLDPEHPEEVEPTWVIEYYKAVYDRIKGNKATATVHLNCAGCRDVNVMTVCDQATIVEATYAQYNNPSWWQGAHRDWWLAPPKPLGHTIHTVRSPANTREAVKLAKERKARWVYSTDCPSSDYGCHLPKFWRDEVNACRRIR
jgi:hypothetical protein